MMVAHEVLTESLSIHPLVLHYC